MDIFIPQISSKYFTAKCVCSDSKSCGQISRSFRHLKDLRGSFIQFPMNNGSQRFNVQNAIKTQKAKCFSSYLDISNPFETCNENGGVALIVDRRNRKKKAQDDINFANQKGIMRKSVFVALHHFHPRIIDPKYDITKVECNGTRFKLPDLVPISKLESGGLMGYYSPNDRYDEHTSIIVPNYPLSKSAEDLTQLYSSIQQALPQNSNIFMKSSLASKLESGSLMECYKYPDKCCGKCITLIAPNCPLSKLEEEGLTTNEASIQQVLPHTSIISLKSSLVPSKRSRKDASLISSQSAKRLKLCKNDMENTKDVRMELKLTNDAGYDMRGAQESMHPGMHVIDTLDLATVAILTDVSLSNACLINSLQKQRCDVQRDLLLMELLFLM